MGIIRFLFAVCVITGHIPFNTYTFFNAALAVKSFFVISGFYMALILNEKYSSYGSFMINRFLRLFPIYWLVLLITFIFVLLHQNIVPGIFWGLFNIPSLIFILFTNLFIIGQDVVMFMGFNIANGSVYFTNNPLHCDAPLYQYLLIAQAWSISIEIMFYLAAPFLVKRKSWLIILVILLSTLFRMRMAAIGFSDDPWSYRFFPFELTYFCFGILSYKIYAHLKKLLPPAALAPTALTLYFIILGFTIGFLYVPDVFSKEAFFLYPLLLAVSIPFIFPHFKSNKWDRYIGDLSYPIYICHSLIICIIHLYVYPYLPPFWQQKAWGLVMITVVLFSMGLLKFVSDPIDRFRQSKVA